MSDAEKRQAHEAKVAAAWADLSLNPSWQTVFEDLQRRFKLLDSSFTAEDNYHATAAAFPLLPVFTAGDNGFSSASGNCRMTAFRIIGAIATDGGNDLCEGYLL